MVQSHRFTKQRNSTSALNHHRHPNDYTLVEAFPSTATSAAASASSSNVVAPSASALKSIFLASAIPMIGFGFMDNFVMIQAGQYIDNTLGVQFGLATLTAAAAGQVVSDVSGVLFGNSLESFLRRMGLVPPLIDLSTAQRQLPVCRRVRMAGAVGGVMLGCALGACTLLTVDLQARERQEDTQRLLRCVTALVKADPELARHCEQVTLYYLKNSESNQSRGEMLVTATTSSSEDGLITRIRSLEEEEWSSSSSEQPPIQEFAADRLVVRDQHIYLPVVISDDRDEKTLLAIVELQGNCSSRDLNVAAAKRLGRHVGIVMKELLTSSS